MRKQRWAVVLLMASMPACMACGGFGSPTAPDPTPSVVTGNSVDMGNAADESHHSLHGWGDVNLESSYPPEPDADRTARYQLVRLSNTLELVVPQAATPYTLTFRTQDGACDDSFDVYVNGKGPLYKYRHRASSDRFPIHSVNIEAAVVPATTVTVNFFNVALDNCGFAAVYYVRLN